MSEFEQIKFVLKAKTQVQDGIFVFLPKISDFQKQEIEFHNKIHQDETEIHQLNSLRNRYYHKLFKKNIYNLPQDSIILEVGAGNGYDAKEIFNKGYNLIISDISLESIKGIKQNLPQSNRLIYLVADGQNLPLADNSVDTIYMVAALHHFENQKDLISEFKRVVKKDGQIIFAMEPSKFMMWFTKLFKNSNKLRIHQGHSEADESHNGYTKLDFKKLSPKIKLKRVWLILGFLHYGLEGLYRILKLKKRIKLPIFIEFIFLVVDEILLKIPIINWFNWHWIAVLEND